MSNLTIITAYLEIHKKKFTTETYINWIYKYMMLIKKNQIVIYTNSEIVKKIILNIRKEYLEYTKIILVNLNDLFCYKYINYFNNDYKRDIETYHDPLLYLIWNNKTAFMYDAYINKYFDSEYYVWTDIGMIRNDLIYNTLNNKYPLENLNHINNSKVYLLEVEPFNNIELNYINNKPYVFTENRCGGGVILCSKYIIEKWFNIYYEMLENFIKHNIFAGKDQNILNNIYLKYPDLINLIKPINSPFDKWFYMLYYLSKK